MPNDTPSLLDTFAHVRRRAWLLMLLESAERSGIVPIESMRLHRLVFLANCLAPVYDLPAADGKILKYQRGPFYPELQWDIDRLVVQGLVVMLDLNHVVDDFGPWFTANYTLSVQGIDAVRIIVSTPNGARVYGYLAEVAAAFATLPETARQDAALEDATYSNPFIREGSLIDFGEWQRENFSEAAAHAFNAALPDNVRLTRRDELHLYFRYLDRMVERRAG
jgi:hypothetical protein